MFYYLDLKPVNLRRSFKACEEYNFIGKEYQPLGKLTISIGVASSTKAKTAEGLFIMADNALYNAKRHNRNKVVIA